MGAMASAKKGRGAKVYPGGTTFRVWAPDVAGVAVIGDFLAAGAAPLDMAADTDPKYSGYFSLDVPGAGHGQKYRFIVTSGGPGDPLARIDPRAKCIDTDNPTNDGTFGIIWDHSTYGGFTDEDKNFVVPSPGRQVIYELHLGSFSVLDGKARGTWASAMAKLDDLKALGINVIEVMPPTAFQNSANWGYDIMLAHALAPAYGTPDDAKAFIHAAHLRGIAVIFDWVPNHMSSATPLSDWEGERNAAGIDLTFASYNDNCGDGIYFYTGPARNPTNYGPRPDFGRADVCKYWTASMLQFVRDYYIDGFRLDSVATARFDQNNQPIPEVETWLHHLNTVVQSHVLGAICDAEDLQDCMDIVAANGFDFNSQWNDDCYRVIQASMVAPSDSGRNIDAVKAAIQLEFNGAAALPAFSATAYADNHDQARSNGRLSAQISTDATDYYARKRALLGGAIVLTGLGRPLILQGQEFNATAPFLFPTPTPLDWRQANIASGLPEAACCAGIRLAYTDIINLRTSSKSVAKGLAGIYINMFHVDYANQVIAYHRWDTGGAGDDTVVIHNLSNQRLYNYWLGLPRGGTWRLRVNTDAPCYSPDFGTDVVAKDVTAVSASQDGLNFSGAVNLGPYSTLIFSQDETP